MRVFITTDSKEHLCDSCPNIYPDCKPVKLEFGDGFGNDNIIACSEYTGKQSKTIEIIKEIVPRYDVYK